MKSLPCNKSLITPVLMAAAFLLMAVQSLFAQSDPLTITISDQSGLTSSVGTVWVAGWINGGNDDSSENPFQVLQANGTFESESFPTTVPFYSVASIPSITLDNTYTGNNQLIL